MAKYIIPVVDTEKFRRRLRYVYSEYNSNKIDFERILVKRTLSAMRRAIKKGQDYAVFNILDPDLMYHNFMTPDYNTEMNSSILNDWGFHATPCLKFIDVPNRRSKNSLFVVVTWGKTPY